MNALFRSLVATLLLAGAGGSTLAWADGAREIHPLCVASGCFAGDAPGFPVEITEPGRYRLTGNLDLSGEPSPTDTTGIEITASDVDLDLNGFSIQGGVSCLFNGTAVSCSLPEGAGDGIAISGQGVSVRSGAVVGVGRYGISCLTDARCTISDVEARSNASIGILFFQASGLVRKARVSLNRTAGIAASSFGVTVRESQAFNNGSSGIEVSRGNVFDSTAYENVGTGVSSSGRVFGNMIFDNLDDGLSCFGCNAQNNMIINNNDRGAVFTGTNLAGENIIRGNGVSDIFGAITLESAPNLCSLGPC